MSTGKIFISHSHKDQVIAKALVDLLVQAGVDQNRIVASSSAKTHIHTGSSLYGELRTALSRPDTHVIFLLSKNFYASTVCMNEMGAAWVMGLKFDFIILPGFSFEKVAGVITETNPVGISLSTFDDITLTRLGEMYKRIVGRTEPSDILNTWISALQDFKTSVYQYKKEQLEAAVFAMDNVESYCIGDTDNDGCRIIQRESSQEKTKVRIDFSRTTTKLCSIVYTIEQKDWTSFFRNGKTLCFEAYCDGEPFQAEVELQMSDRNKAVPLLITDDTQTYRIPLSQFTASTGAWREIKELCFLFRKKHIDYPASLLPCT